MFLLKGSSCLMLSNEREDNSRESEKQHNLLFIKINYRIEDVAWEGKNIRVMDQVTISPPYHPENVQGNMEKAVNHVRKIVSVWVNHYYTSNKLRFYFLVTG